MPGLHWHWQRRIHMHHMSINHFSSQSAVRCISRCYLRIRLQLDQAVLHLPHLRLSSTWCDLATLWHKTRCECRHLLGHPHWPGQHPPAHLASPHSCLPFAGKKLSPNVLFLLYGAKKHFQPGIWHVSKESLLDVEGGSVAAKLAARRRNSSSAPSALCPLPAPCLFPRLCYQNGSQKKP